jgi:hypothetical protein
MHLQNHAETVHGVASHGGQLSSASHRIIVRDLCGEVFCFPGTISLMSPALTDMNMVKNIKRQVT